MDVSTNKNNEDMILRSILNGTASETGAHFFRALVKTLSQALGTYGAWVTEYLPEMKRLRAFAFWLDGHYVEDYEYDIRGTPCEKMLNDKKYLHVPDNVVNLFPGDPDLLKLGAVSYIGFPLFGSMGEVIGNLAVIDTDPMPYSFRNLSLFKIFGARATAEILRLKAEAELQEKEEKLRKMFEGAMDAIVEFDSNLRITILNPSAQTLFGLGNDETVGMSIEPLFVKRDFQRLTDFIQMMAGNKRTDRKTWISGGLTAIHSSRKRITTEATLSQLEMAGEPYYVIILRNVEELFKAEKIIASLKDETHYLRNEINSLYDHGNIIGHSQPFQRTLKLVSDVSPTDSTVLIYGETGTGKELIARAIHASSQRKERSMITVNCAAIPASLIESELFGHEKGSFTGATQKREGRFQLADKGTLFLDEVGELDMKLQAKLLRVLQEGEFSPVGSSRNRTVDVRVIAATNVDLAQAVQQGTFRTDLYYRLSVFPISIPPLRERLEDIEPLAVHFTEKYAQRMAKKIAPLSNETLEQLKKYSWPGNVRELENVIERSVITARHGHLDLNYTLPGEALAHEVVDSPVLAESMNKVLTNSEMKQLEKKNLILALEKSKWKIAGKDGAAHLLGIPPSTLQSRMNKLGIERTGNQEKTIEPAKISPLSVFKEPTFPTTQKTQPTKNRESDS